MLSSYLRKKKAVLIFCPTKNQCEIIARKLASQLPIQFPEYQNSQLTYEEIETEIMSMMNFLKLQSKREAAKFYDRNEVFDKQLQAQRLSLLNELKACPSGLCQVLKETIKYGIAYHHSGLTTEEREVVERVSRLVKNQ